MTLKLSPRQREVMTLKTRDGLTNVQIGKKLFISDQTVKNISYDATQANGMNTHQLGWHLSREDLFDELARRAVPDGAGDPDCLGRIPAA